MANPTFAPGALGDKVRQHPAPWVYTSLETVLSYHGLLTRPFVN
jgi:hypothetical protein